MYQQIRTCSRTCSNPYIICIGNVSGCGCPTRQLIDEDRNRCVHPYDCPSMITYIYLQLLLSFSYIIIEKNPCHQPPFSGSCHGTYVRYFYNVTSHKCEKFIYGGCYGNENNFFTLHECQEQCSGQKCLYCDCQIVYCYYIQIFML